MKAEGQLAGAADLWLSVPSGKWHGMYIEMKAGKGTQSEHQKAFQAANGRDYLYTVCRTFDEFRNAVNDYLNLKIAF